MHLISILSGLNRRAPRPLLTLFSLCVLAHGAGRAATAPTGNLPSDAVQRQRWESTLLPLKSHLRPHAEVEIDVRFTGPGNATMQVPAFWDGDRGFRFRAAFPTPGTWQWQTTCNDPSDTGLHGRTGEVRVSSYRGDNPLYQHGELRVSANRRHLEHADGTPFLWLADSAWNVAVKSTPAEWQEYVDARAKQRFSVLQVIATGLGTKTRTTAGPPPFLADGTPDPVVWRDLDEKVAFANDRGLIVFLTGIGKSYAGFTEQQRPPAFTRYVAGRFAAHAVIFSPSMDQRFDAQNDEAGARLPAITSHLITQHPATHFETSKMYHDASYSAFCGLQSGHHNGNLTDAYEAARKWTLELWQREPIKPVINIEAMYDAHGHNDAPNWREQDARKLGWISWLCGSRGYTYGAGDVPPKVPTGAGGIWRFSNQSTAFDHWRKALHWPSATQMTHLRNFFAGLKWWRLVPAPELVRGPSASADSLRQMVASRSESGDLLVAYLPDNDEITLDLRSLSSGLKARWFNPITGNSLALHDPLPLSERVTLRRPDGWSDAVLVLTKPRS